MNLLDIEQNVGFYAGLAAFIGLTLIVPLYFSQARDIRRLRTWMALTPDLRVAEQEAAEAVRLAEAIAEAPPAEAPEREPPRPAPPVPPPPLDEPRPVPGLGPPAPGTTPARTLSPAERIALDRPATARITAERTAVTPPPTGIRRFTRPTSSGLAGAVAAVLLLAIAVVFVVLQTGGEGDEAARKARPSAVIPSEVEVAVLNGTAVPDLASKVGDDVEAGDFVLGPVTNSEAPFENTTVMYEPGSEDEGQAVAKELGVPRVVPMDADTRALADGAPVAVIAGMDRAQ